MLVGQTADKGLVFVSRGSRGPHKNCGPPTRGAGPQDWNYTPAPSLREERGEKEAGASGTQVDSR